MQLTFIDSQPFLYTPPLKTSIYSSFLAIYLRNIFSCYFCFCVLRNYRQQISGVPYQNMLTHFLIWRRCDGEAGKHLNYIITFKFLVFDLSFDNLCC